jgi:hypothetical protein
VSHVHCTLLNERGSDAANAAKYNCAFAQSPRMQQQTHKALTRAPIEFHIADRKLHQEALVDVRSSIQTIKVPTHGACACERVSLSKYKAELDLHGSTCLRDRQSKSLSKLQRRLAERHLESRKRYCTRSQTCLKPSNLAYAITHSASECMPIRPPTLHNCTRQ